MKFLTVSLVFMVAMCGVQAFLAKLPKLVVKYDSEEDDSPGVPLFPFPKFGLFGEKKEAFKDKKEDLLEALLKKDTLFEKLAEKTEHKFDDRVLGFFDDEKKAKTVYDKLQGFKFDKPADPPKPEPQPEKCPCPTYEDCGETIRYFS